MRNLFFTIIALFLLVSKLEAQVDSIAKATATITVINDSVYKLQVGVNVQNGWKVYDANAEGVDAPVLKFTLETAELKNKPQYSVASVQKEDPLFGNAKSFTGSFDIIEEIVIHGFQPDSLKGAAVMSVGKGSAFYVIELPIALPLANGQKTNQFKILLPESARNVPKDACGGIASNASTDSGAWGVFLLGF